MGSMSITTEPARDARLDLRLPRETRELIVEAAALSGASLTDYVLNVVVPTARRDVIESRTISLSKKAWDALPDDLKKVVEEATVEFNKTFAKVCDEQEKEMFAKSFKEWGTTYIEWGKDDIDRITKEFSLPFLNKIEQEIGSKDPRVAEGIQIIKQFMKDRGYIN